MRRKLSPGQEVFIIYDQEVGFTEDHATFIRYESKPIGETVHQIPVFQRKDKLISGLECFWILTTDVKTKDSLHLLQYELISVQLKAIEIAEETGYELPIKIRDRKLKQMALDNASKLESVIKKLGFDPRDESWIESELAENDREAKWFKFERENGLIFAEKWDDIVSTFNTQNQESLSLEQAKNLSKKRMRYILGAYQTRMQGNPSKQDWRDAAKSFEKKHRERENRMLSWTLSRKDRFPLVKAKKPIRFFAGPFFSEISELVPHLFTDTHFNMIKSGIILRVISYDPQDKHIRLDFTEEIRTLIHKNPDPEPWKKDTADYDIWLKQDEIDSCLEFLEPL